MGGLFFGVKPIVVKPVWQAFCLLSVFLLMRFSECKKTAFLFIPISSPPKVTFEQRMYGLCCGYVRAREVNSLSAISQKYGFRANKGDYSHQL